MSEPNHSAATIDFENELWRAGEAARRYGVAKSPARYRMSVDPRAVKRDGSWWMPEEIVRQEWAQ